MGQDITLRSINGQKYVGPLDNGFDIPTTLERFHLWQAFDAGTYGVETLNGRELDELSVSV